MAKNKPDPDRDHALARLREMLPPGARVTTTVLHVSRSGMRRSIMCQAIGTDYHDRPAIVDISWQVARVIREKLDQQNGGVIVQGCGMDMTFEIVYRLGRHLYPDGFGIEPHIVPPGKRKRRPTSPEQAQRMRAAGYEFRGRNGDSTGWDRDGGYALDRIR